MVRHGSENSLVTEVGRTNSRGVAQVVTEIWRAPRIVGLHKEKPMLATINDAAKTLGIGRTLLYRLINSGELDVVRLGARTLVTRASIEALIERKTDA